jgi:hypothetical protein
MKRLLIAIAVALLVPVAAFADLHGAWTMTEGDDGCLYLNFTTGQWNNWGRSIRASDIGLDPATIHSTTATPVTFEMRREPGTISFEGTFKRGDGAGQLSFTPNPNFAASIRALGIEDDLFVDRTDDERLLSLALADVTIAYARSMKSIFPDITFRELRRARGVDLTPDYVTEMRAVGVNFASAHDAVRLRSLNVTPKYVNELAAAGYKNLSFDQLRKLAAHGITPEFIRRMTRKD